MKAIPQTEDSLVLRTDFSSEQAWDALCFELRKPVGEFQAYVTFISDPENDGATIDDIVAALQEDAEHSFLFVVDAETFSHEENPILVLDLHHEPGRSFRAIPRAVQSIENNLSIANMDFEDFADSVDEDGVFRGFCSGIERGRPTGCSN